MIVRRVVACTPRRLVVKHSQKWHIRSRPLSTASASPPASAAPAQPILTTLTTELDRRGPRIDLHADQVHVIHSPKEFYKTLKDKIRNARKRIFFATLYVGREEHELMATLHDALANNPDLEVSILTDALRGTRESPETSCATLLASLAVDFPDRVEILMYHTSNLTGLRKRFIPQRINEGWGLQHMKLYGIDDEIILSGANLSQDYFIDRQDRYHLFSSAEVTSYFHSVYMALRKLCWRIDPQNRPPFWEPVWPERSTRDELTEKAAPDDFNIPSPLDKKHKFDEATRKVFEPLLAPNAAAAQPRRTNTSLYPMLILPKAQNTELPVMQYLLSLPYPKGSHYLFTAGYFNPHPLVTSSLLALSSPAPGSDSSDRSSVAGTILTASPWANGFFGSKGVSGMLTPAYDLLAKRFLERAQTTCPGAVSLREWRCGTVGRPHGWTYHSKGLWITVGSGADVPGATAELGGSPALGESPAPNGPAITIIGSSNYTVRSYSLDTEASAVLVTSDAGLQRRLKAEADNLLEHTREVSVADLDKPERRAGPMVKAAMWFVTLVGGSL